MIADECENVVGLGFGLGSAVLPAACASPPPATDTEDAGASLALVGRTAVLAGGSTLILVGVAIGFALALHAATGLPIPTLVLAYAPGGLAEMSLIALALSTLGAAAHRHAVSRTISRANRRPAANQSQPRPKAQRIQHRIGVLN